VFGGQTVRLSARCNWANQGTMIASYPHARPRRTRATAWSRALHREVLITPADLIWPLFVTEGTGVEEPVASLPGVSRWSVDGIVARAKEAVALGIPCLALFPNTQPERRSDDGREALNPDNLMCRAIRAIRDACGDAIGILTDVALDPYTSHGQDGLIDAAGYVENDATVEVLVGQALNQANAGSDIIAPSDMMDGRVGAIREALEVRARQCPDHVLCRQVCLGLLWPVPRCGGFARAAQGRQEDLPDGPRQCRGSAARGGDGPAEGADSVMVKPGLPYLDIAVRVKEAFGVPVFAYQVSGEYAMIEAAVAAGAGTATRWCWKPCWRSSARAARAC
jgi:porphobilinogen synthase